MRTLMNFTERSGMTRCGRSKQFRRKSVVGLRAGPREIFPSDSTWPANEPGLMPVAATRACVELYCSFPRTSSSPDEIHHVFLVFLVDATPSVFDGTENDRHKAMPFKRSRAFVFRIVQCSGSADHVQNPLDVLSRGDHIGQDFSLDHVNQSPHQQAGRLMPSNNCWYGFLYSPLQRQIVRPYLFLYIPKSGDEGVAPSDSGPFCGSIRVAIKCSSTGRCVFTVSQTISKSVSK